jgi:hypothetical protein
MCAETVSRARAHCKRKGLIQRRATKRARLIGRAARHTRANRDDVRREFIQLITSLA